MSFEHILVLFQETIDPLNIKSDGIYIDGTAGGGGHSETIVKRLGTAGTLLAADQDPDAIEAAKKRPKNYPNVLVRRGNFSQMDFLAEGCGITGVGGVLMDIGVFSHQLDMTERGSFYYQDAPLGMYMNQQGTSAADLVNTLTWQELARILNQYGEEKSVVRIAKGIVAVREERTITTMLQLVEVVRQSVPAAVHREPGHPARKTSQALRIQANGELDRLSEGLNAAFLLLKPGGRLAVITFHLLEGRIAKKRMAEWCRGCICPPDFPICACGRTLKIEPLYKRGFFPSEEESKGNPCSRSSRLGVCTKLD